MPRVSVHVLQNRNEKRQKKELWAIRASRSISMASALSDLPGPFSPGRIVIIRKLTRTNRPSVGGSFPPRSSKNTAPLGSCTGDVLRGDQLVRRAQQHCWSLVERGSEFNSIFRSFGYSNSRNTCKNIYHPSKSFINSKVHQNWKFIWMNK